MIARYASAATTGTLMTFAILFAMQAMIQLQPFVTTIDPTPHRLYPVSLPPPRAPQESREEHLDRETIVGIPVLPVERPTRTKFPVGPIAPDLPGPAPIPAEPIGPGKPDSPLISLMRVQPVYPPSAAQRALEGWVDVRFDVAPDGLTRNIAVIASSHHTFERAALDAAARFRFRAPVVDGTPRTVRGIEYRFRFRMDE